MECAGEYKVIIDRDFVERRIEVALEYETSRLIDDDQGIYGPGIVSTIR